MMKIFFDAAPSLFSVRPIETYRRWCAVTFRSLREHVHCGRTRRQADPPGKLKDADKAEKLIRNLARRLEQDAPGVSASILEGLDEILTVTRLGLPKELRRALACTNIVENVMSTARRVCRNVKRWRSAAKKPQRASDD
jgi:hypothetical protein